MFFLTGQERRVIIFIGVLILAGSILRILNIEAGGKSPSFNGGEAAMFENSSFSRPVNINSASSADLEGIPGIGRVIARRIIAYRDEFGYFGSLEELKKVKGIGDKKIEALKKYFVFN